MECSSIYGCETWTIGKEDVNRIEAFEMWCYRRIMRISWMDRVTNEAVHEDRETVPARRDRMVGHMED